MQFNSLSFVVFFAVVLALHNLPLSWRVRKFNLLWLSYVFYAAWNPPFVVLLWLSTVVDWVVGNRLQRTEQPGRRRLLLLVSLVVNLGMLSYFKYGAFVLENFVALMQTFGVDWNPATPSIALPIGISFYTFQTLSYTLDIHAKRAKPATSFLDYALFVTFFPQLVAGPIVRGRQFLPQCLKPPTVSGRQFAWGMTMIIIGIFEKVVIADGLLSPTPEAIFDGTGPTTMLDGWLAATGFTCQVFCDFAGYSLSAIGVAHCLGFKLPMNFNFPLASSSFTMFWSRWHMSLSTWLRDYVFFKLKARSNRRRLANMVFTMVLVGLWHGASWGCILWGFACGAMMLTERFLRAVVPASAIWRTTPMLFVLACLQFATNASGMLFFRSSDLGRMAEIVGPMFTGTPEGREMLLPELSVKITVITVITMFLFHWFMRASSLEKLADRCHWSVKSLAIAVMLFLIVFMQGEDHAFIYFQF